MANAESADGDREKPVAPRPEPTEVYTASMTAADQSSGQPPLDASAATREAPTQETTAEVDVDPYLEAVKEYDRIVALQYQSGVAVSSAQAVALLAETTAYDSGAEATMAKHR